MLQHQITEFFADVPQEDLFGDYAAILVRRDGARSNVQSAVTLKDLGESVTRLLKNQSDIFAYAILTHKLKGIPYYVGTVTLGTDGFKLSEQDEIAVARYRRASRARK